MNSLQIRIVFSVLLVILGLAIVFLFTQNQATTEQHKQAITNRYISQLEQLDARLEKQILLMDSWYFRSYDELNSVFNEYKTALDNPPVLPPSLEVRIPELQELLRQRFPLIERMKSNNALLRNSLNYLPSLIDLMFMELEKAKYTRSISAETSALFRNYLQQKVIQSLTNQLVDYRLDNHLVSPYQGLLPDELLPVWKNTLKHLSLLDMHRENNIRYSQQLEALQMLPKLEEFNKLFSEHLASLDQHREQQQTWLILYILAALVGTSLIAILIYALRHYHAQHSVHKTEAMTDTLTGLGNRRMLEEKLPELFQEARRKHSSLGVLFIDLDGFKAVNDTLGHQRGDELLQSIADELQQSLRENDLVIRFGGDEFVLVIPSANQDILQRIARNTLQLCSIRLEDNIHVSASIGISHYPSNTTHMHELVELADQAMYQAKQQGKQCVRFYKPADNTA